MSVNAGQGDLARNTVINLLGQVLPMLAGLIAIPSIIRLLGMERFGILALAWAVLVYFAVFDFGLTRATTKFVAELMGQGRSREIPSLIWTTVAIQGAFGLIGSGLLILVTPFLVHRFLAIPQGLLAETETAFYWLAVSLPAVLTAFALRGAMEAARRFDLVNAVKVPSNLLTFIIPWIGAAAGLGLAGIMAWLAVSRYLMLVAFWRLSHGVFPGLKAFIPLDRGRAGSLFGFGGWLTASYVCGQVVDYLERFLIGAMLGVVQVAFYSAPAEVLSRLLVVPAALSTALFPALSATASDRAQVRQLYSTPLRYLLLIMTPVTLLCASFAGEILGAWLGQAFVDAARLVFVILACKFGLQSFAYVPLAVVHGLGRPDLKAKLDLVEAPVFVGLCLWLLPAMGLNGAALAKLMLTVLDTVALFFLANRTAQVRFRELCDPWLARGLALSLGAAGAIVLGDLTGAVWVKAGVSLAALGVFCPAFVMLALETGERAMLKSTLKNLLRRISP